MKSTKLTPAVQLDQVLDICVDVSKSKLNVYFELVSRRRNNCTKTLG